MDPHDHLWRHALKTIIGQIDARLAQFPSPLTATLSDAAACESWHLLRAGLDHLAEGAPCQQAGSLTLAVSKASLRSSSLAATLAVPAPVFAAVTVPQPCHADDRDAALFITRRLCEATLSDIDKSTDILARAIQIRRDTQDIPGLEQEMAGLLDQLSAKHYQHCTLLPDLAVQAL